MAKLSPTQRTLRAMKINAKNKRNDAEKATVHYAREIHKCVVTRRAVRARFQSVDFFGSDIVGKKADGSHVYIQTTAGQYSAVTARRRKLEKIPWHPTDTVELLQLVQTIDPANARRKLWFFRVHYYERTSKYHRTWQTKEEAVPVPREWFKAWSENPK